MFTGCANIWIEDRQKSKWEPNPEGRKDRQRYTAGKRDNKDMKESETAKMMEARRGMFILPMIM